MKPFVALFVWLDRLERRAADAVAGAGPAAPAEREADPPHPGDRA